MTVRFDEGDYGFAETLSKAKNNNMSGTVEVRVVRQQAMDGSIRPSCAGYVSDYSCARER